MSSRRSWWSKLRDPGAVVEVAADQAPAARALGPIEGPLFSTGISPKTLQRQVWGVSQARRIPGVGKSLDLVGSVVTQMPLDLWRGPKPLARPRLLVQPDLRLVRPTWMRCQLDDYQLHGNACSLVTVRDYRGRIMAERWFPASSWHVREEDGGRRYWLNGVEVDPDEVTHVQNGADDLNTARGVGVIERYVDALDRVALLGERQRADVQGGNVPSVAITAPAGDTSTDTELDEQARKFEAKFNGPGRRPVILPNGTEITPLAWSPNDAQAVAMSQLALTDVANMFNLDGYWLGAPASSHTYRTPGVLFLSLLRTTINGVLMPFEATWSQRWAPAGVEVRFGREAVLGEDLKTTMDALTVASGGPIMTRDEARNRIGLGPTEGGDEFASPQPAAPPAPEPETDPNDPEEGAA